MGKKEVVCLECTRMLYGGWSRQDLSGCDNCLDTDREPIPFCELEEEHSENTVYGVVETLR